MSQRTVSRTQRRMEKKQAIILLVLVLAVSLVSFSLGVMVGRGGASKAVVMDSQPAAPPVAASVTSAAPTPTGDLRAGIEVTKPETQGDVAEDKPVDKLTFYDTLPRGDVPLGSGINLPPAPPATEKAEQTPVRVEAPQPQPPPVEVARAPQSAPKQTSTELPVAMAGGNYVVQIASFKDYAAASKMRERLSAKGYSLFVEQADLGSKGIWHRVYAGPYTDKSSADKVAVALKNREKLSPLVRKR